MGKSRSKAPRPDPAVVAAQQREAERVRKEKEKEERLAREEEEARRLGLRGARALFGSTTGFGSPGFLTDETTDATLIKKA